MITPEEIEKNWNTFVKLLSKVEDRGDAAVNVAESLGTRLATCPASSRKDYHSAYPGGLVEHSLRVLGNVMRLNSTFEWNLPKGSMIIGALFHDLGKVGDHENDYYLPQEDSWRLEKLGEVYSINRKCRFMTVPDRGVWLCQHYGLRLTIDEMLAIKLNDGQYIDENRPYSLKEPLLALAVHMADMVSMQEEKNQG